MLADIDIWCQLLPTQLFLRCDNMHNYDFSGIRMIEGCKGDALAASLVRESCNWVCKHNRPYARCLWEFAHEGVIFGGRLRACWLAEDCGTQDTVVSVVCEPNPRDNTTAAEIATLEADLSAALSAHSSAVAELAQAKSQLNQTNQEFNQHNQSRQAQIETAEQSLYLAQERLSGITAELHEAQKELEAAVSSHAEASDRHEEEKKQLQTLISQATAHLNSSQSAYSDLLANHTATKMQLTQQAIGLLDEVKRYADLLEVERESHDETKDKLRSQTAAHEDTKNKLKSQEEEAEEARAWLTLVLIAFGFVMLVCLGAVVGLMVRQRKWRNLALSRAAIIGGHVVMGRPVGVNGSAEDSNKTNFQAHQALQVSPGTRYLGDDDEEMRRLKSYQGRPTVEASPSSESGKPKSAWS